MVSGGRVGGKERGGNSKCSQKAAEPESRARRTGQPDTPTQKQAQNHRHSRPFAAVSTSHGQTPRAARAALVSLCFCFSAHFAALWDGPPRTACNSRAQSSKAGIDILHAGAPLNAGR